MKHLERIYYILLMIGSIFLVGITSLLSGTIKFDALKTIDFWWSNIGSWVATICITIGTVYMCNDKFKEKNEDYIASDRAIAEFARSKENIPSLLHKYMDAENKNRKKAQHKYNIQKKSYKLQQYHSPLYYLWFWNWGKIKVRDKDIHIWNYGTEEEKKNNAYCNKMMYLEEQISDDYINKNIDLLPVRFKQVNETVILGGYYNEWDNQGPNDFIETNMTGRILKNKIPKMLITFGIIFGMTSVIPEAIFFNPKAIYGLILKILLLAWNGYLAINYSKNITQAVILHDVRFREGLITEYKKWLSQKLAEQQQKQEEVNVNRLGTQGVNADGSQVHSDNLPATQ